ncbi:glycosyltransferase [Clostridiaceae bacterium DONG20-135]|uniref:Glycosyltransferase n=1 Tax=Copranaerobaculum intestinale TaxID=2692629 RepID=A0A6N8U3J5_9FIRM|nr:glycosyltransferase [Copranaerobaculum intestinale]MXQ72776.1 glycosyltransferase [Copranaerobaculum intestinale]
MENKILHVVSNMDRGGIETLVLNLNTLMLGSEYTFDYVIHGDDVGHYEKELKELHAKIYHFPKFKLVNTLQYIRYWRRFMNCHPEYKIIHCHIRSYASVIYFAVKRFHLKFIIHSHNTSNGMGLKNKIKDILQIPFKLNLQNVYRLACSKDAGDWLFGKKKYYILRNGILTDNFRFNACVRKQIRTKYGFQNKHVLGHIGGFRKQKNHMFLLDVFKKYCEQDEDARLVLLGSGDLYDDVILKSKELHIYDKITFVGNVSNVHEYMNMFDIFVFPSLNEGLPLVLVEAQMNGLVCIVSDQVPNEVALTEHLYFLPLNDKNKWCNTIADNIDANRYDATINIKQKGYDLQSSVEQLKAIYGELLCK